MHIATELLIVICNSSYFYLFSLIFFVFGHPVRHVECPRPGVEPLAPAVEAWSRKHWTAGEVPIVLTSKWTFGKQTIYNLGTDLTLTTLNSFKQKVPSETIYIKISVLYSSWQSTAWYRWQSLILIPKILHKNWVPQKLIRETKEEKVLR